MLERAILLNRKRGDTVQLNRNYLKGEKMGFFDDYDILGGLSDLVCAPFKAADEVLFGPSGEVGGLIGTPINIIMENPGETALVVVATALTGGVALVAAGPIAAAAGGAGLLGATATTGTACVFASNRPPICITNLPPICV